MKKKRETFSEQIFLIVYILYAVIMVLVFSILIALYQKRVLEFKMFLVCILLFMLGFSLLVYIFEHKIMQPFQRKIKKFKKFNEGLIYEELFEEDYQMVPELQEVFQRLHNMLDKQSAIKISTKQAEYLALQNQINPHFLYNTLDAIRGDALCAGKEDIANITEALSKFFRYTITETENLVTLESEIENAENYFAIQEYRFGGKLKIVFNLPEEPQDILRLKIPKLTLQPIIENAIFHGLEKKANAGVVVVDFEITDTKFYISIKDDGVGISEEKLEELNAKLERVSVSYVNDERGKSGGIALKNVCRRIKLLFGEEYGIHVYSLPGMGTDVRITIPNIHSEGSQS
ncbi:two-component system, sensor histidine kinase YesM [Anaerocolumna jejuensis DSM 15929]|uniref:Two-component system, sensor histidine kinase YesM n=1 Tax=Anaerocolumna jejuensis DSM 15929 TaxID=1121322 RepID=A0A1M6Q1L7_9FIRM|nr:histidine kinase [Anaerocolumna jejuensis]SHK14037.1 two-component system, sensor histidine kinase YesM [Anaerocolumna jejuensis DSM 15929]